MEQLKAGDVVVLKSNPDVKMTIVDLTESEAVCEWLNSSKKVERHLFPLESLEKPTKPSAPRVALI